MIPCAGCGTSNEDHAAFCQKCGVALKFDPIPKSVTPALGYGGFWLRFVAWIIDATVVSAATGLLITVTFGVGVIGIFFAHWLYEAFMLSSSWQTTLGKKALGMVVTDIHGQPITFARATGRHFAKWLSGLLFCVGFIMAGFTRKKQALHDMLAETVVVKRS